MEEAAQSYVNTVLRGLPDEEVAVSAAESTALLANPFEPSEGFADEDEEPYDPWEDDAAGSHAEKPSAAGYLDIAALRARANK